MWLLIRVFTNEFIITVKCLAQALELCYKGVMQLFQVSGFDIIKFSCVQWPPLKVETKEQQKLVHNLNISDTIEECEQENEMQGGITTMWEAQHHT